MICTGPECNRPHARNGLCWGHYRQRQRGKKLRRLEPRDLAPIDVLREAALGFAEAESEPQYSRALARLRMAALRYARKTPPGAEPSPHPDGDFEGGEDRASREANEARGQA